MTLTAAPQAPMQLTAERAPFVMLPRWLLHQTEISDGAKVLYCVLHDLVVGREGPTRRVTRAELAEACAVSPNTIDRRLTELIDGGAVDKEPQILAGGQVGNVYRVWLTPPEQRRARVPTSGEARSERIPTDGDPVAAGASAVDNRLPTDGEARSGRIVTAGDPPHPWGDPLPAGEDPTVPEEQIQEFPPQPPRPAGGPDLPNSKPLRRRAAGTNPRALAEQASAERERAEADRHAAQIEREAETRRAEADAARVEAERVEAEASALSAALNDSQLEAIVEMVSRGLAGPLARSPLAMSWAVLRWCRASRAQDGATLADAIQAGLVDHDRAGDGDAPPLRLPAAPTGTVPLRRRIAGLLEPDGDVATLGYSVRGVC